MKRERRKTAGSPADPAAPPPARSPKAIAVPASMRPNEGAVEVGRVRNRPALRAGKPVRLGADSQRSKIAYPATSSMMGGSGGNIYSPELSPDFLELPQSADERRNFFRHFYRNDPFVGQAIDLHTELPLSKVRLSMPKARDEEMARRSWEFCSRWARRVSLLQRLLEIVHDYNLFGEVYVYPEDTSPDMPEDITHEFDVELDGEGIEREVKKLRSDADARAEKWLRKNYRGWTSIRVLPPEQVHMETFPFTDEKLYELIPDSKTKDIINRADAGDGEAKRVVDSMPVDVVEAVRAGSNIPLNTDPDAGSFVYYLARKRSQYEPRGYSILDRCIRTLVYRDKLRQAQTSISSRHMTPIRLVWAEDLSEPQLAALQEMVDLALQDPDFSIVTNFQVNWEEMGADQRLLDLSGEYEMTDRQMYAGLGVTESLLSGESSYSGDRINLEVVNTRYMLLREILQEFVEDYLLKPMCRRMGFVEVDEDGNEEVVVPGLSFTRLALRDNSDTFDNLLSLYQKGSLDIDVLLDLLNIDPHTTAQKLKRDAIGFNDSSFNEVLRSAYGEVGRKLVEESDITARVAATLGLNHTPPAPAAEGRF